jgi:uncharacterized protein (TIGR02186 family)
MRRRLPRPGRIIGLAMPAVALCAALALPAAPGAAEQIIAGLSQSRVAITADFDGSEILIYGAVKREEPAPEGRSDVIVTVEGPSTPLTIRRKDRVAGIWINNAAVTIDLAPSFYAVATTGPLDSILSATEDLRHRITIPRAIRAVGTSAEADDAEAFVEGLIRVRSGEDRFRLAEGSVEFTAGTLFRADVLLPANLTEGAYRVRLFLVRDGRVVNAQEQLIDVRKAGLERFLFNLAQDRPLVYGLLSLLLAGLAGWAASEVFRRARL